MSNFEEWIIPVIKKDKSLQIYDTNIYPSECSTDSFRSDTMACELGKELDTIKQIYEK